jgi:2-methylfumaryl-CoA isomerase
MSIPGILAGLRVVEVSAFVAAPLAGATLAAMGADVIRVEQLGGGIDARRWPLHDGRSLYRQGLDQGKRSVSLDLRSADGHALATQLVRSVGILITNLPARGWLEYERLAAERQDLIMVVITGTPDGGAAVDYTVNAGLGFPWVTGPEETNEPVNHVLPSWDVATGVLTAMSVLAAERHRSRTGEGQLVRLALSDVGVAVTAHLGLLAEARLIAEPRGRYGNDVYGTFGRPFRTREGGFVMVCALTVRQWQGLAEATRLSRAFGEIEARHEVDLRDEGERFRHRAEIAALLEPWVAARSVDEVGEAFEPHGVLWGPYRTFKELVASDPAAADPYASPVHFGAFERSKAPKSPRIGQDTRSVLETDLGLNGEELAALRARGVID